jgi:flagellar hook-associated protein 1 FlgK
LTQAQTLRQQTSGVSLNAEAANLISFERAYQASAKLLTVLDSLTQSLLSIIPSTP